MSLSRFGVSLDEELLKALDEYVADNSFANRSQALRHLIETILVEKKWKCDNIVAGALTLVFDHTKTEIIKKSSEIQFDNKEYVLATHGYYLNDQNYLQIIAVKGPSRKLTEISEKLISIKGVQHGKLVMSKAE